MATTNERITNGVHGMLPQYNMKSIERINKLMDTCDFMGMFGTCTPSRDGMFTGLYCKDCERALLSNEIIIENTIGDTSTFQCEACEEKEDEQVLTRGRIGTREIPISVFYDPGDTWEPPISVDREYTNQGE